MGVRLVAQNGLAKGEAVAVKGAKFFIGSHEKCQLRPNIPGLAGVHALLEERGGIYYVRDFGAEGGTGVNERVVHTRETEVFDGDLIKVGRLELMIKISAHREETPVLPQAPLGWPFLDESAEHKAFSSHAPAGHGATPPPLDLSGAPIAVPAELPETAEMPQWATAALRASAAAETPAPPPPEEPPAEATAEERPVDHHVVGDALVVTVRAPDLNDEFTVGPLRTVLRGLIERDLPRREVLDLSNVTYMSSRAVGVILAHYQALHREGGAMRVCGVHARVMPVLKQMHLNVLIDIYETCDEALGDPWSQKEGG